VNYILDFKNPKTNAGTHWRHIDVDWLLEAVTWLQWVMHASANPTKAAADATKILKMRYFNVDVAK